MATRRSRKAKELAKPVTSVRLARPMSLTAQTEQVLRQLISQGYLPGGQLPTEVELADQLGVSRETVRRAAGILEKEGLLVKIRSRGTFAKGSEQLPRVKTEQPLIIGYLQTDYAANQGPDQAVSRTSGALMLQGASEEAGQCNGHVVSRHAPAGQLTNAWRQLHAAVSLGGLIFASCGEEKLLRRVLGLAIPAVLVDHDLHLPQFSSVRDDSFTGAHQAVKYLVSLGHRQIALAHWHEADLNPWRLRGYRQGLRDANLPRRQKWEFHVELTEAGARKVVQQLMALAPRPTALFCFNNTLARFIAEELTRLHVRVPEDLSVMGAGGEDVPGLTCTMIDWYAMGRTAVQMLRSHIDNREHKPEHRLFPHQLRTGRTAIGIDMDGRDRQQ